MLSYKAVAGTLYINMAQVHSGAVLMAFEEGDVRLLLVRHVLKANSNVELPVLPQRPRGIPSVFVPYLFRMSSVSEPPL
jgi:hypothetical protein